MQSAAADLYNYKQTAEAAHCVHLPVATLRRA